MSHHLAQVNIGRIRGPVDSEVMREFKAGLDPMNALAEASPGFVWRLKGAGNNASDLAPYPDPLVIVNLSVWTGVEELRAYAYGSAHVEFFRRRREWFERFELSHVALWWIAAGTRPTVDEARERLAAIDARGSTPFAFTFRAPFPPPAS